VHVHDTKPDVRTYTATSQQILSTHLNGYKKKTQYDTHSAGQVILRDTMDTSTDCGLH